MASGGNDSGQQLNSNGYFSFAATQSPGTFVFYYKANDGATASSAASVSITVVVPQFVITAPASVQAGAGFLFTVVAESPNGNDLPQYTGTVHFTSSDPNAVLPADATLSNGVGVFTATLGTVGNQTLAATDATLINITGTRTIIAVTAGAFDHFAVTAPSTAVGGTAFTYTVIAQDAFNNTVSASIGSVYFSTSDLGSSTSLPASGTLTNGVGTFSATLTTAGDQSISVMDGYGDDYSGSVTITVTPLAATHFAVFGPSTVAATAQFFLGVVAEDEFNNTVTTYTGTVHLTSSDAAATLAPDSTLTSGIGQFSVSLATAGSQTLTATDSANANLTGTSGAVAVVGVDHFAVSAPTSTTAGNTFTFTVTAQNASNNTVTAYNGPVELASSDLEASLPYRVTLAAGVGVFTATLVTAGDQTLTPSEPGAASITGTSGIIAVSPAAVASLDITMPASTTAGTGLIAIVAAVDQFNNVVPSYAGTVAFTTTDSGASASVPANYTFVAGDDGVHTFSTGLCS